MDTSKVLDSAVGAESSSSKVNSSEHHEFAENSSVDGVVEDLPSKVEVSGVIQSGASLGLSESSSNKRLRGISNSIAINTDISEGEDISDTSLIEAKKPKMGEVCLVLSEASTTLNVLDERPQGNLDTDEHEPSNEPGSIDPDVPKEV